MMYILWCIKIKASGSRVKFSKDSSKIIVSFHAIKKIRHIEQQFQKFI